MGYGHEMGLNGWFAPQPPALRLQGEHIHVRPPVRGDWPAWAALRAASRDFLKPWEPSWTADALSRAAFRRRLARYALDWRDDEGYSFFIFHNMDGSLLGGIGLSNLRRGVAETASLGYWIGQSRARQGFMTEAVGLVLCLRTAGPAPGRGRVLAVQHAQPHIADQAPVPRRGLCQALSVHRWALAGPCPLCAPGRGVAGGAVEPAARGGSSLDARLIQDRP
jgi:ribosomal-protein-alanine N-acetyltransferase